VGGRAERWIAATRWGILGPMRGAKSDGGLAMVVFVATLAGCAAGPRTSGRAPGSPTQGEEDRAIPTDLNVLHRTLGNGFTYYLRRSRMPSAGAYVGLVVKSGWSNEGDGQRGLAHLIEHMAFSGTPRFETGKLAELLVRLGLQPTPDANVVTSVDFTIYGLALRTNATEAVPTVLDLLADWSSGMQFDAPQVDRVRRAVLEEMRQPGGPERQHARQTLDLLLRGEVAAAPLSPSAASVLEKATPEQLLAFYQTWYRPERMALVVLGDFDLQKLEQAICDRFQQIKARGPAGAPPTPFVQLRHDPFFATLPAPAPQETRSEEPGEKDDEDEPEDRPPPTPTVIAIGFKRPRSPARSRADLRQSVIEASYDWLVQARLNELVRRPASPLSMAKWSRVSHLPLLLSVAQATVKPGRLAAGAQALWAELRRIGQQGFNTDELAGAVRALQPPPPGTAGSAQAEDGMAMARNMTAHFLYGDALLSVEGRQNLEQKLLGELHLSEINALAMSISRDSAKVVLASGPKDQLITEQALRAAAEGEGPNPGTASDAAAGEALLDTPPRSGSIVREESINDFGASVWTLSNGARVVVKRTGFTRGEVLFQARAPGGTSLATDRDYWSASLAPEIVTAGGLGRHAPKELRALLAGRTAEGHPWISETEHGIRARATSSDDLELVMQLVHLGFTAPRRDPEALEEVQERWREELRNRDADPNQLFASIRRQRSYGNHPRRRPATLASIAQLRLDAALDFYRQRFSRASDFTFLLVGDVDAERLKPLVERYLASLPDPARDARSRRDGRWRDVGARLLGGVKRIRVERGQGDASTVVLTFHGEAPWSREGEAALGALGSYLEIRARRALVQIPLAARSISVTTELERRPVAQALLTIAFDCNRAVVDEAKAIVLHLVREVKESAPVESDVVAAGNARKERLGREWRTNTFWLQALGDAYGSGSGMREIEEMRASVERIDGAMVNRAARDYLDLGRYIDAVRSPVAAGR
jgi:zinc protease